MELVASAEMLLVLALPLLTQQSRTQVPASVNQKGGWLWFNCSSKGTYLTTMQCFRYWHVSAKDIGQS